MNSVLLSQYAVQRLNYVTMSMGLWGGAVSLWRVWGNVGRRCVPVETMGQCGATLCPCGKYGAMWGDAVSLWKIWGNVGRRCVPVESMGQS